MLYSFFWIPDIGKHDCLSWRKHLEIVTPVPPHKIMTNHHISANNCSEIYISNSEI